MRYGTVAAVILAYGLIGAPLQGQAVRGRVTDYTSGEQVRGAAVLLLDGNGREIAQATTDTAGLFEVRAARAGEYRLRVSRLGYLPFTSVSLALAARETIQVRVQIASQPIPVAPVVVTARSSTSRLAEFENRRTREAAGHFITRQDIERRPIAPAAALLEGVSGVEVVPIPMEGVASSRSMIMMRGSGPPGNGSLGMASHCQANVFLDGVLVRGSIDDFTNADWLGGIEVYVREGTAPVEYRRGNGCGVVLFWTRDPERAGRWSLPRVAALLGVVVFGVVVLVY